MHDLLRRYGLGLTSIFVLLTAFWLLVLVILPNITMFESSFRPYLPLVDVGGPMDTYSFGNYLKILDAPDPVSLFGFTFDVPLRVQIFCRTIYYSAVVTVITFVLAYPVAYYLAKIVSPRSLPTLFLLLFVPLWVSEILRAIAWWIILTFTGPMNALLLALNIIDAPLRMMGYSSVVVGLVYTYVLFMVFPLYNAISSLDSNQIEAAEDLGSSWWRTHWRVILPHAKPGIASGSVMVFMLCAGSILVPTILGGTTVQWFTQTVQTWMLEALDWNSGAAFAFILLILCTVFVFGMMRIFRVKLSDIAK